MRLLHPRTIKIIANEDINYNNATVSKKQIISHTWAEVIKYKSQTKSHPKVFIHDDFDLGVYTRYVYDMNKEVGCKLNPSLLERFEELYVGFTSCAMSRLNKYFDDHYLFSDAVSLYYKGINIFPHIYGDNWQKYCPVISLKEIKRQVDKTIAKGGR